MSNFPPIPERLRLIDEIDRREHFYLVPGDHCLYIWERMSKLKRGQWDEYPANNLISNLQIPISCKNDNPSRYRHKRLAIDYAAEALGKLLGELRNDATYVPVPPSRVKSNAEYDPRLLQVLRAVDPPVSDVRELILLKENCDSKQKGRSPHDRAGDYVINESRKSPKPHNIVIFDDVLTTGSHFKAMEILLAGRFPQAEIYGLFLTRAVRPTVEDDDVSADRG